MEEIPGVSGEELLLRQCFTKDNWPDAIFAGIEMVGYMKCRHEMTHGLANAWVRKHGYDKDGAAKFILQLGMGWTPPQGNL